MFSFLLRLKRKIRKLLKVRSETRELSHSSFQSRTFKVLLIILVSILVGVFYPGEALYDPFDMPRMGEIALEDVLAPFQITIFKTEREISDETDRTELQIPFVIDYDTTIVNNAYRGLRRLLNQIDSLRASDNWEMLQHDSLYVEIVSQRFPLLSKTAIVQSFARDDLDTVYFHLEQIYRRNIYLVGVLPDQYSLPGSLNKNVVVRRGEAQSLYGRDKLYPIAIANARLLTALNKLNATTPIDVEYYYLVGRSFIHPNLRVNMAEYNSRVKEALASISKVKEVVEPNDIVIRSGQKVSERQQQILQEMVKTQRSQAANQGWVATLLPVFARMLLVFATFLMLYLFLYFFRKEIYKSNPKLLALILVFALQLILVYLASLGGGSLELSVYLYPVVLLPIVVTILFDAEVGILSTVVMALLLGIMHRFNFTIVLMTVVVGTVACFASTRVRRRTHFFRITWITSLAFVIFILLVETMKLTPNADILSEMGYGLAAVIVTSFLAIGILPVFESIFGITTDITLLELSDPNQPLLKRLAVEAPGTYHHSIVVGNLAEAAAKEIGGNSLLARVGAYYHDIGKIEIPEYFVENQLSVKSKHEDLTPSMSSLILSSHVKIGRNLGEEENIPDDVLDFIEEHHGTMVQSYFYAKAIEAGVDQEEANKFRYPGPRPQTRETGIAMLADAVEAASRTLDDPKPARLENLIQRIINDRFQSGELSECPLTLRDLAGIKKAFTQVLIGTFHHRVAYPKKDKGDEE